MVLYKAVGGLGAAKSGNNQGISQPTFISGANLHFGKIELNTSLESMEKCDSENEGLS